MALKRNVVHKLVPVIQKSHNWTEMKTAAQELNSDSLLMMSPHSGSSPGSASLSLCVLPVSKTCSIGQLIKDLAMAAGTIICKSIYGQSLTLLQPLNE